MLHIFILAFTPLIIIILAFVPVGTCLHPSKKRGTGVLRPFLHAGTPSQKSFNEEGRVAPYPTLLAEGADGYLFLRRAPPPFPLSSCVLSAAQSAQGIAFPSCTSSSQAAPDARTSEVKQIFDNFFYFHLYYFYQHIPIGYAILRRCYSCHFLAKRHSLGVTSVFL